jgi:hypothetical protein
MTNTAKDFWGHDLVVGDTVVFMAKNYRFLKEGIIVSISDKMLLIEHEVQNSYKTKTRQCHSQVIKKPDKK